MPYYRYIDHVSTPEALQAKLWMALRRAGGGRWKPGSLAEIAEWGVIRRPLFARKKLRI